MLTLAAALAQLGKLDQARSAVKAGLTINPAFAISRIRASWTAMSDDPDISGWRRAHSRRSAQGRSPRTMTANLASPRSSPSFQRPCGKNQGAEIRHIRPALRPSETFLVRRPTSGLDPKAALTHVLTTGRPFERPIAPSLPGVSSGTASARPSRPRSTIDSRSVRPHVASIRSARSVAHSAIANRPVLWARPHSVHRVMYRAG